MAHPNRSSLVALAGCALATIALTALVLRLVADDPLAAVLAVPCVMGVALVALDFAWAPLHASRPRRRAALEPPQELPQPGFVDTQATWRLPVTLDTLDGRTKPSAAVAPAA